MNAEQVNREIAEKVMKFYTLGNSTRWWFGDCGRDNLTNFSYIPGAIDYFDPMHRIEHSMMALEKFPYWELGKDEDGYYCMITLLDESTVPSGRAKTKEEAICLAALAAKEGINES